MCLYPACTLSPLVWRTFTDRRAPVTDASGLELSRLCRSHLVRAKIVASLLGSPNYDVGNLKNHSFTGNEKLKPGQLKSYMTQKPLLFCDCSLIPFHRWPKFLCLVDDPSSTKKGVRSPRQHGSSARGVGSGVRSSPLSRPLN